MRKRRRGKGGAEHLKQSAYFSIQGKQEKAGSRRAAPGMRAQAPGAGV